jgi:hypothetical protein
MWRTTEPWWAEPSDEAVTPKVRARFYHQEYLLRVAPDAFRRAAIGAAPQASTDPGKGINRWKIALRGRQERRMRERIERELAELLATR